MSENTHSNGPELDGSIRRKSNGDNNNSVLSPIFQSAQRSIDSNQSNGASSPGALQRKHTLGARHLMRTSNNRVIQSTLTVNAPGDTYEREANSVADRVMSMSDSAASANISSGAPPTAISRVVQTSGAVSGAFDAPASTEANIQRMEGGGEALESSEVDFFAQRMGYDFSNVRIHTGSTAVQASRDIQAKAFTFGNNIAFNSGSYKPGTSSGRHLLAHELTHVVQQGHGQKAGPEIRRKVADIQRDGEDGQWEWTRAEGEAPNTSRENIEVESFTQRLFGLFMPARAMLNYSGNSSRENTNSQATVNINASARFRRFTSIGRVIATGWQTHNAGMSQAQRWELDRSSGNITTGVTAPITDENPIDGPLAVTAGVTKRVENVNSKKKKLVLSINAKAVVGANVSESVSGGGSASASAGGHEGAAGGEVGLNASTSWSISYNGGQAWDMYRANFIFTAENKAPDTEAEGSGTGSGN